jgi:hypothetical protein
MAKRRTPKRPRDMNELAKRIVDLSVGDAAEDETAPDTPATKRGRARAAKLSPERRRTIAKKAAAARWKKQG